MDAEMLILDTLMKLDKEIEETERDLEFMNKQIGKKLQKLAMLKDNRRVSKQALDGLRRVED